MAPYVGIVVACAILGILLERSYARAILYAFCACVAAFIALRYRIGPDWQSYDLIIAQMYHASLSKLTVNPEILSNLLYWIAGNGGGGIILLNTVGAISLMAGVAELARRTPYPWLALASALSYLVLVFGMSGVRQSIAIGLIFFGFAHYQNWGIARRIGWAALAAMFHTSGVFFAFVAMLTLPLKLKHKLAIAVPLLLLTLGLALRTDAFQSGIEKYYNSYFSGQYDIDSGGSLFHIAMVVWPALVYLAFRRKLDPFLFDRDLVLYLAIGALFLIPFNFVSTTAASRLGLYFFVVPIAVLPAICAALPRLAFGFVYVGLFAYQVAVASIWFSTGNMTEWYVPYRSYLA